MLGALSCVDLVTAFEALNRALTRCRRDEGAGGKARDDLFNVMEGNCGAIPEGDHAAVSRSFIIIDGSNAHAPQVEDIDAIVTVETVILRAQDTLRLFLAEGKASPSTQNAAAEMAEITIFALASRRRHSCGSTVADRPSNEPGCPHSQPPNEGTFQK